MNDLNPDDPFIIILTTGANKDLLDLQTKCKLFKQIFNKIA